MKREELEAMGLSKEQIDKVLDAHHTELGAVQKALTAAQEDLKASEENVKTQKATIDELNKSLDDFKGEDVAGLKKQISDLEESIKTKDADHQKAIADRDFKDILEKAISSANGLNSKAITALLDLDTLKASKNQKEDVAAAIKNLVEAEDSKMLFGTKADDDDDDSWEGNPIGAVRKSGNSGEDLSAMRAAMGLPAEKKE